MKRLTSFLLVAALGLAACGGGGDSQNSDGGSTTGSSGTEADQQTTVAPTTTTAPTTVEPTTTVAPTTTAAPTTSMQEVFDETLSLRAVSSIVNCLDSVAPALDRPAKIRAAIDDLGDKTLIADAIGRCDAAETALDAENNGARGPTPKRMLARSLAELSFWMGLANVAAVGGLEIADPEWEATIIRIYGEANEALQAVDVPELDEVQDESAPSSSEPVPSEPVCSYTGLDESGDMQVELFLRNSVGAAPLIVIDFALLDADNVRFLSDTAYANLVAPDEILRVVRDTREPLPQGVDEAGVSCQLLAIDSANQDGITEPGPTDSCEFIELDGSGDIQVELMLSSPFAETTDIAVSFALRGGDGIRFDEDTAYVDLVPVGGSVRDVRDTRIGVPDWAEVGDVTCQILGLEDF